MNESLEVARLHVEGEPWEQTILRAMDERTTSLPKSASNRRTLREISNRLLTLSADERLYFIEEADRSERQARFLFLFLGSPPAVLIASSENLPLKLFASGIFPTNSPYHWRVSTSFLRQKAEWNEGLAGLSRTTQLKLRQIMFRMMREAGIISEDDLIQTAILSTRLKSMIEEQNPGELGHLPQYSGRGSII